MGWRAGWGFAIGAIVDHYYLLTVVMCDQSDSIADSTEVI